MNGSQAVPGLHYEVWNYGRLSRKKRSPGYLEGYTGCLNKTFILARSVSVVFQRANISSCWKREILNELRNLFSVEWNMMFSMFFCKTYMAL